MGSGPASWFGGLTMRFFRVNLTSSCSRGGPPMDLHPRSLPSKGGERCGERITGPTWRSDLPLPRNAITLPTCGEGRHALRAGAVGGLISSS
jgi:hypothetical protein